jgi:AcrR family transcriptional regulator
MSRKEDIILAFVKLYRESKNYETISLKAIAAEAGIGKSTIYEYFKSKEELIASALLATFKRISENVLSIDENKNSFEQSFKEVMGSLFNKSEEVEFLMNVNNIDLISMVDKNTKTNLIDLAMDFQGQVREKFNIIFTKGIAEGIVAPDLLLKNYLMINALVFGSIRMFHHSSDDIEIEQFIDDLFQSVLLLANRN